VARLTVGLLLPPELADARVADAAGGTASLRSYVGNKRALVVFLRHFGCVGCSQQVAVLTPRLLELDQLGVKTFLVGNGLPEHIDAFVERHQLGDKTVMVLTDPSRRAFKAAGFRRSVWSTFGVRAIWDALRAFGAGHRQYGLEGDPFQQGGVVLVDEHGRVAFHHENRTLADYTEPGDVVEAALRVFVKQEHAAKRGVV